jgi:SAM-dependent methyltransferase/thioredoxin reductase
VADLPVVVIGAGPQGLAAAAHLWERGLEPIVLEAGDAPAAAVSEWGHVRLFSRWPELVDAAAARLLAQTGWTAPASGCPTGAEWVSGYLAPLAAALRDRVRYGARVIGVGRRGRDRLGDASRADQPFIVHMQDGARLRTRAVIDASGTWRSPSPAGANGIPAPGENAAVDAGLLMYRIPSFQDAEGFAGRHVVVVGNGHSAATAVIELARIARRHPSTRITWVLRRALVGNTLGGGGGDEVPAARALGQRARAAVTDGLVDLVTGFCTERVDVTDDQAVLVAEDGRALDAADRVVVLTGFRPDLSFLSEVRLELDCRFQAPVRMAADVDPSIHACDSVRATGAVDLAQPETDFYIVGAKSYGRASSFLALNGYEQARSVAVALAGSCSNGCSERQGIREAVRSHYAAAAERVTDESDTCCGAATALSDEEAQVFGAVLYGEDERGELPDTATMASLGCGNPAAVAELRAGETVLDLGSGGGIDVLLSARRVGPAGTAYGLDMTEEMLALARENQRKAKIENVRWLRGAIEAIPLPASSVDVVISNCVINLSEDKALVLAQAARVLKPGGRFAVTDVIADEDMDEGTRADLAQWASCISGALTRAEFERALHAAGLVDIEITETHRVHDSAVSAIIRARKPGGKLIAERPPDMIQAGETE